MRIALFGARGIPHTYSGTETFFGELAPRLAARGHDVIVYCRRSLFAPRPRTYQGVRLIYLPSIETKNLSTPTHSLFCAFDVLFRDVDVMLVTNVANAFHCAIPRLFGKKVALNVDGVEWKRSKWSALGREYFRVCAKMAGKICSEGIITDAVEMQRIYLEEFATPSVCIAYGGNIQSSSNPNCVRGYGLEPGEYYLIASRLVPENNADMIVEGFLRTSSRKLLAIAGDANYDSPFVNALKAIKDPRVRLLGHVANSEHVRELHASCFAYVHGHSVGGTNPALLKALGYGNCVLALNTAFNRETLEDYGVLFDDATDLSAKMCWLENNPSVVMQLREHAPDRIRQKYNWEFVTDQYEDYFRRLVGGECPAGDVALGMYTPTKAMASQERIATAV